jgi:hypothetical protein
MVWYEKNMLFEDSMCDVGHLGLKNGGYEETICNTLIKILETLKDNFKFHFRAKKARR